MPHYTCTKSSSTQKESYSRYNTIDSDTLWLDPETGVAKCCPDEHFDWKNCLGQEKEKEEYALMLLKVTGLDSETIAKIISIQTTDPRYRSAQSNAFLKEIVAILTNKFA